MNKGKLFSISKNEVQHYEIGFLHGCQLAGVGWCARCSPKIFLGLQRSDAVLSLHNGSILLFIKDHESTITKGPSL